MTTKDRKEREKLARKKAIVDAAREVFFKNGFQATTMDQIAEVADLSKGSLYLHFPTKEELYVTILIEGLEMLCRRFEKAVTGVKDWETQIRNIGNAYYAFYYGEKNYFQILFLLQHGEIAPKVSDELRQACFEKGVSCLNILCKAIETGMTEGEIEGQNAMELAVILWGAVNGIFLLYEEEDYNQIISTPLDQIIQTSIALLINGLRIR
jgi:AcrR family transcriptional regulator